jgi:acyl-CoA reductase-like NAD-dependent aldehyde dehydrogenase
MSKQAQIISPVDGSVYATRDYLGNRELYAALERAALAQRAWRASSMADRAALCLRVVDAMLAMEAAIVPELAWQMGRPIRYGAGELRGFAERARHMIAIAPQALADLVPEARAGFTRYIRREPVGVVFVIAPWNYPYLTAVNAVIPALMAGNAVLLKHASQTFLVGDRFQQALDQAGAPAGLFQHVLVDHASAAEIIRSGRVHQVNFTGSVAGGRAIAQLAAERFLGAGLELGGKDPAYVCADADLEDAVANLVDGSYFNSGQSCCGIERIYVDQRIHDEFVERFQAMAYDYVLGSPLDSATTLGPMVTAKAAAHVRNEVRRALAQGARALIDATRFAADAVGSSYLAPQLVVDVNHSMSLMREENFGPVVGVMAVASDEEAIALMNDSDYGLTASIWTRDLDRAQRIGDQIETGTVFMNRCDYLDPALAWTGVKETGRGATLSSVGYEHLTRPKSFHLKHAG